MNIINYIFVFCVLVGNLCAQDYDVRIDVRALAKVVQEIELLKKSNSSLEADVEKLKSQFFPKELPSFPADTDGLIMPVILSANNVMNESGTIDLYKKSQIINSLTKKFPEIEIIKWDESSSYWENNIFSMISHSLQSELHLKAFFYSQLSILISIKSLEKLPSHDDFYIKCQTPQQNKKHTFFRKHTGRIEETPYQRIEKYNPKTYKITLQNVTAAKQLKFNEETLSLYVQLYYQKAQEPEIVVSDIFNSEEFSIVNYQIHPQSIILIKTKNAAEKVYEYLKKRNLIVGPCFPYRKNLLQKSRQYRKVYFCTPSHALRFDSIEYPGEFYVDGQKISVSLVTRVGGTACYSAQIPIRGNFFYSYMGYRYTLIPYNRMNSGIALDKPEQISIPRLIHHFQSVLLKFDTKAFFNAMERFASSSNILRLERCSIEEKNVFLEFIHLEKEKYPQEKERFVKILEKIQRMFRPGENK